MEQKADLFSNQALKAMIVPLFLEQLLMALVGIADVFVVGFIGEAAVSGVSLVNSFNTIFLNLFTALASGGAVVISQYIGRRETGHAGEAATQLLTASVLLSVVISIVVLVGNASLMRLLFGKVEEDVMDACVTYLRISAYSYPALAIYNAGAALYRSFGKTSTTMYLSIAANVLNVIGNCIGVFVLHAGVAGVAWPSLIARTFSAVVITVLCFSRKNPVRYFKGWLLRLDGSLQKRILGIAIPNGVESGIFQLVKVALSSVVALFGTYQIAANGVAQSIWSMASLVSVAMGPVFITVIGQCMGAGAIEQAEVYFKKLMKITLVFAIIWNGLIFAATPVLLSFYALAEETKRLTILLVLIHNIFSAIAFPFADPMGKGLRAAGDVRFTTAISLFTTIGVRLVFSVLFGITLNLGVMGIAWAMCLDWSIRGIIFILRQKSGKWKAFQVI
ncbi:MATE family efflux transporter [Enterocloster bolteae]|uniref:MATE family efflux transporter n=1 Tax=Enterocloster bolteae TaxID=208479 RepID=UPI0028DC3F5A|nr:MATE family efflux transporter [Enterocloster bolteae]